MEQRVLSKETELNILIQESPDEGKVILKIEEMMKQDQRQERFKNTRKIGLGHCQGDRNK